MNWITNHTPAWNGWIAMLLYWLPLALCAYGYFIRGIQKYRAELQKREQAESKDPPDYYNPELTIGTLIGYALLIVLPIANLFAATFDVAPRVFGDFFVWIGKVFNIPLVPKRKGAP